MATFAVERLGSSLIVGPPDVAPAGILIRFGRRKIRVSHPQILEMAVMAIRSDEVVACLVALATVERPVNALEHVSGIHMGERRRNPPELFMAPATVRSEASCVDVVLNMACAATFPATAQTTAPGVAQRTCHHRMGSGQRKAR